MTTITDTRTRLLEATYVLMLSKGYPSTTVDEICQRAEVSKGSFYHFFKSKQQLALEMLGHHMAGAKERIERGLDLEGLSGAERAIGYVRHLERVGEEVWRDGCLIGGFALELADTHPEVRERVSQIFGDLTDYFETVFAPLCPLPSGAATSNDQPASDKPLSDAPQPRELAEQLIMVIEGGVVLSRAHRDSRFVPQSLRCFRRYLELLVQRRRDG